MPCGDSFNVSSVMSGFGPEASGSDGPGIDYKAMLESEREYTAFQSDNAQAAFRVGSEQARSLFASLVEQETQRSVALRKGQELRNAQYDIKQAQQAVKRAEEKVEYLKRAWVTAAKDIAPFLNQVAITFKNLQEQAQDELAPLPDVAKCILAITRLDGMMGAPYYDGLASQLSEAFWDLEEEADNVVFAINNPDFTGCGGGNDDDDEDTGDDPGDGADDEAGLEDVPAAGREEVSSPEAEAGDNPVVGLFFNSPAQ